MKHAISLLTFLCSCTFALGEDYDTQPLFAQLSAAIDSIPEYDAAHRKAIDGLKQRLSLASGNAAEEMRINNLIIDAYYKLSYDSTRAYLDRNLQLARELGDAGQTTEMYILFQIIGFAVLQILQKVRKMVMNMPSLIPCL